MLVPPIEFYLVLKLTIYGWLRIVKLFLFEFLDNLEELI